MRERRKERGEMLRERRKERGWKEERKEEEKKKGKGKERGRKGEEKGKKRGRGGDRMRKKRIVPLFFEPGSIVRVYCIGTVLGMQDATVGPEICSSDSFVLFIPVHIGSTCPQRVKTVFRNFFDLIRTIEYTRVALGCTLPPVWLVPTGVYLIKFLIGNLSYSPCSEPGRTVLFPDVTSTGTMYARHLF